MSVLYLLKAPVIGLLAALPIGPVAIMAFQKSINDGRKAGLSCGLGGTFVDVLCAIIASFALGSLRNAIDRNASVISLAGGAVLICIGLAMALSHIDTGHRARKSRRYDPYNFFKAAAMGLGNPAALAVMFALFAGLNMDMSDQSAFIQILTIIGVGLGSATYWYLVTALVAMAGERFNFKYVLWFSRAAGIAISCFGAILICKAL